MTDLYAQHLWPDGGEDPYEALFASQNMRFRRRQYREKALLIVSSLVLLGALIRLAHLGLQWIGEKGLEA